MAMDAVGGLAKKGITAANKEAKFWSKTSERINETNHLLAKAVGTNGAISSEVSQALQDLKPRLSNTKVATSSPMYDPSSVRKDLLDTIRGTGEKLAQEEISATPTLGKYKAGDTNRGIVGSIGKELEEFYRGSPKRVSLEEVDASISKALNKHGYSERQLKSIKGEVEGEFYSLLDPSFDVSAYQSAASKLAKAEDSLALSKADMEAHRVTASPKTFKGLRKFKQNGLEAEYKNTSSMPKRTCKIRQI